MHDSHCHVNDEHLFPHAEEVISRAHQAGVDRFLFVGWDEVSSRLAVELAHRFPGGYAAVGFHPENLEGISEEALARLAELAKDPLVIAIGEIGLDYHWFKDPADHEKQKKWFARQIELANALHLPVSIHARDASGDTLALLREHPVTEKGVLHCYSGSRETMKELAKLGYYFGFDGPITFKNSVEPKECVKGCPLDRILAETDSPYMAPVPHRGETNEPCYIPLIVEQMALLKGISLQEMELRLEENFDRLFHVKHE